MRFKKIFAMLLTGIMTVSMPGAVFAASTEEQIADVQAQKEAAQAELAQQPVRHGISGEQEAGA